MSQHHPPSQSSRRSLPPKQLSLAAIACLVGLLIWFVSSRPSKPGSPSPALAALPLLPILDQLDPTTQEMLKEARHAVSIHPKDGEAWGRFALNLLAFDLNAQAIPCLEQAESLQPANPRWPYLLGRLLLTKDESLALTNLTKAANLSQNQPDYPRLFLARVLMERGRFNQAREHLILLRQTQPNHAAARLELARLELAQGDPRQVPSLLSPCLTNRFTAQSAYLLLASSLQKSNQPALADQARQTAQSLPPDLPWPDPFDDEIQILKTGRQAWVEQCQRLLSQHQLAQAQILIQKLIQAHPQDSEGWLYLGRLHLVQTNFPAAASALQHHLNLEPDSVDGRIQQGLLYLKQNQPQKAVQELTQAVTLKPDAESAYYLLGQAQQRLNHFPQAMAAYTNALRCRPGFIEAYVALAQIHQTQEQPEKALDLLNQALALNPFDLRLQQMLDDLHGTAR